MKRINRENDLPEWFDKNNYKEVRDFSAAEWLARLRIRKNILDAFSALECAGLPLSYAYEIMPATRDELDSIRRSPLALVDGDSWAAIVADFADESSNCPVRPLKLSDIARQYATDRFRVENGYAPERYMERWGAIINWPTIPANTFEVPLDTKLEPPHDIEKEASHDTNKGAHAALFVDLRASDAVLKQAFDRWLNDTRISKRERLSYHRWADFGLLPYLDLSIWERETENKLTRHLMAQKVGYASGGDSFQKTVPGLANQLMSDLGELEAIAATDLKAE